MTVHSNNGNNTNLFAFRLSHNFCFKGTEFTFSSPSELSTAKSDAVKVVSKSVADRVLEEATNLNLDECPDL